MPFWIIFTLLNIFGNGTALFLTKSIIKKEEKLGYSGVMFVTLFYAVLCYIPVFLYSFTFHPVIFSSIQGLYFLMGAIFVTASAFFLYVHALALNDLSVFGPLDNLRPFFVVLFSFWILGQQPTSLLLFGIVFIVGGAFVLTMKKDFFKKAGDIKKTLFILSSTGVFGLAAIFDKKTLFYIDPFKYTFFILAGVCGAYGILYFRRHKKLYTKHFASLRMLSVGLFWAVGYIGIMIAVKLASPNLVTPLQMTRSLFLSVLGFIFLKEKGYTRKLLAAGLMLIGVFLITR